MKKKIAPYSLRNLPLIPPLARRGNEVVKKNISFTNYIELLRKKNNLPIRIFFLLIIFLSIPQISLCESLNKIVDGLQANLNNTIDFTASFIQETELKSFDEKQITDGKVYIMKPGKMKWEYKNPEPQTIVVNNKQVWIYTPEDRQVMKTKIKELGTSAIYDLFFSEKIKINQIFNTSLVEKKENSKKSSIFIKLLPKNDEGNINNIVLELNRSNYEIKSFVIYDKLDNITTIKFSNFRVNQGLKTSIFEFKIPEGVELITSESLGFQ